jgi:hypothetical protein
MISHLQNDHADPICKVKSYFLTLEIYRYILPRMFEERSKSEPLTFEEVLAQERAVIHSDKEDITTPSTAYVYPGVAFEPQPLLLA